MKGHTVYTYVVEDKIFLSFMGGVTYRGSDTNGTGDNGEGSQDGGTYGGWGSVVGSQDIDRDE